MAIDERTRHELYLKLEHVLGPTEATTLMEHLPPVGWADVATKHDLVATKQDLKQELAILEQKVLATLHSEMSAQTRTFILTMSAQTRTFMLTMVGLMVTFAGLTITAARLV